MSIMEAMAVIVAKDNKSAVNELIMNKSSDKLEVHNKLIALMRDCNQPKYLDENILYLKLCCKDCVYNNVGNCSKLNNNLNSAVSADNKGHYINNDTIWNSNCIHYRRGSEKQ